MSMDSMRRAMEALNAENAARQDLSLLHRLQLDLAHFIRRYEDVETDENTGSIKEAFAECAAEVEKIAHKYLNPDGTVMVEPPHTCLLIIGSPVDGFGYRTFPDSTDALDWADEHLGESPWWVTDLETD